MSTDGKKPLVSFSTGPFSVALWENEIDNGDGSQRVAKSVSVRRVYFDKKENQLKDQKLSVNPAEVGALRLLLTQMEQAVIDRRGDAPF
jgi:hypothetical protein